MACSYSSDNISQVFSPFRGYEQVNALLANCRKREVEVEVEAKVEVIEV